MLLALHSCVNQKGQKKVSQRCFELASASLMLHKIRYASHINGYNYSHKNILDSIIFNFLISA